MKLLDLVTGDDNTTLEPSYCLWILAVLLGGGLEVYSAVSGHPFDLQAYGIGMGTLLALGGAGRKLGS